jgi:hypothetical protein
VQVLQQVRHRQEQVLQQVQERQRVRVRVRVRVQRLLFCHKQPRQQQR